MENMASARLSKTFVLLCISLFAVAFPAASSLVQSTGEVYKPVLTYDPQRNASADLKQAIAEAQRTHRRILLDVGGQWCIWCKYLDTFFEAHPDLKELRDRNYVWMKVNMSSENENRQFLSQYPSIPGYPHLFVLTTEGRFYHSQETKPFEDGKGYNPDRIKEFLNKWAPQQEIDTPLQ